MALRTLKMPPLGMPPLLSSTDWTIAKGWRSVMMYSALLPITSWIRGKL